MYRVANTNTSTMMQGDPRRARGCIQQRVEQRPVGDRIAAVFHRLRFAVWRGHRSTIQVVTPNHNRGLDNALRYQVVEQARLCPVAHTLASRYAQVDPGNVFSVLPT